MPRKTRDFYVFACCTIISTIFANLKMEGKDTDPLIQGSFALMKPCWLYAVFKCHNQALFSSTQLAKHLSPILIQVLSVSYRSILHACLYISGKPLLYAVVQLNQRKFPALWWGPVGSYFSRFSWEGQGPYQGYTCQHVYACFASREKNYRGERASVHRLVSVDHLFWCLILFMLKAG